MSDPHEAVERKVHDIFAELAGDRVSRLDGAVVSHPAREAATAALVEQHGAKTAALIAFHMTDWNSDAAFVVALHLFPERFTAGEIDAGLRMFLTHAPNHIREACWLTGEYVWVNFPDDDEGE